MSVGLHPDHSSKYPGTWQIHASNRNVFDFNYIRIVACITDLLAPLGLLIVACCPRLGGTCVSIGRGGLLMYHRLVRHTEKIRSGDWLHAQRMSTGK